MKPRQFGPKILILYFLPIPTSSSSLFTPSPPISLNPADMTIKPLTPFLPHSSAAPLTNLPGITKIAMSISSSTSNTLP